MASTHSPSAPAAVGSFTSEVFAAALAAQAGAPAWWLERKRAAFARFSALPLPTRTDEAWRFSSLSGLKLDGFSLLPPSPVRLSGADLKFAPEAALTFVNNQRVPPVGPAAGRASDGLIVS